MVGPRAVPDWEKKAPPHGTREDEPQHRLNSVILLSVAPSRTNSAHSRAGGRHRAFLVLLATVACLTTPTSAAAADERCRRSRRCRAGVRARHVASRRASPDRLPLRRSGPACRGALLALTSRHRAPGRRRRLRRRARPRRPRAARAAAPTRSAGRATAAHRPGVHDRRPRDAGAFYGGRTLLQLVRGGSGPPRSCPGRPALPRARARWSTPGASTTRPTG